jgi:hypothetical protein
MHDHGHDNVGGSRQGGDPTAYFIETARAEVAVAGDGVENELQNEKGLQQSMISAISCLGSNVPGVLTSTKRLRMDK